MSTIPSTTEVQAHTVYDSEGAKYAQVVLVPTGEQHWQVQHNGAAIGAVHYDLAGQEWTGTGNHTYPTVGGPVVADTDLDYVLLDLVDQATAFRRSSFWIDVPLVLRPVTPSVLAQGGILYFDEVDPLVLCSVPGCSAPAARGYGACGEHAGGDEVSACPACGDSAPHTSCDADLWEDDDDDDDDVVALSEWTVEGAAFWAEDERHAVEQYLGVIGALPSSVIDQHDARVVVESVLGAGHLNVQRVSPEPWLTSPWGAPGGSEADAQVRAALDVLNRDPEVLVLLAALDEAEAAWVASRDQDEVDVQNRLWNVRDEAEAALLDLLPTRLGPAWEDDERDGGVVYTTGDEHWRIWAEADQGYVVAGHSVEVD